MTATSIIPSAIPAPPIPASTPELAHARPTSTKSASYIPTLDGWRAIAILLVMFDHAGDSLSNFLHWLNGSHLPHTLLHRGQMGVYIFFGLSGYLITTRLLAEHASRGSISLSQFYLRRLFRVFPPMWTYLLVAGVLAFFSLIPVRADQWVSAATFLTNYYADRGWYLGHFWSLCVEEHFYLLWPAALVLLGTRRALVAALAVTVAMPVWRYIVVNTGITGYESNLFSRTDLVLDTLLLGSAAAILMAYAGFRDLIQRLPAAAFYAVAAGVAVTIALRGDLMRLPQSSLLVLLMLITITHAGSLAGRFLENPVMRWIGRLSYSLYVWQQLFLVWAGWETTTLGRFQTFPLNIVASFACAVASYYLVEKPLVNIGHRITHSRGPRNEGAAKT
jgi:peptidoglycan/LPS O-acetylase OafA/YrhL